MLNGLSDSGILMQEMPNSEGRLQGSFDFAFAFASEWNDSAQDDSGKPRFRAHGSSFAGDSSPFKCHTFRSGKYRSNSWSSCVPIPRAHTILASSMSAPL
jgi:hypothetical protein